MKLTDEEVKKVDEALKVLSNSFKEGYEEFNGTEILDDAFLKNIADSYLSTKGIYMLFSDSKIGTKGSNCLCGCSCAQPEHGIVTW